MPKPTSRPHAPFLVPSILWGGTDGLYKVPFHTFGATKKCYLRLKPAKFYGTKDSNEPWVEIAVVDRNGISTNKFHVVKAASPLTLIWGDPKLNSTNKRNGHEMLLEDIVKIVSGIKTDAFRAFIAKNGRTTIPHESCCFSILSSKRSLDLYYSSAGGNIRGRDSETANLWIKSLQSLLERYQRAQTGIHFIKRMAKEWDPVFSKLLFEATTSGDTETLCWYFDHGCPVDFIDTTTGDTVLLVACRLGLYDVARLALHQYHALNDPHPEFGQTALQVAVSSGHANIVRTK